MTETLIEKLEAEKVDYESTMMDSDRAYNQAIDDCIAVVRQHEAAQPQDVQDLLRDMRRQVEYSDKATMPIPLYERMKVVITAMGESKSVTGSAAGCKPASLESDGSSPSSPTNTDTLIGKLEVIDLALDKSIDVNDEYMDEAKSLLTKLIKEVQQREIRYNDRLDLEPAWLAKACDTVREKGLNEKSTLEYVAAEAIREYLRHIFPNGNIMPQNDKKQQNVTVRELLNRLGEIQEYAGQFFGCRCDQEEDCAPGDCWPCRMVTIANMANPDDEELPMRELSVDFLDSPVLRNRLQEVLSKRFNTKDLAQGEHIGASYDVIETIRNRIESEAPLRESIDFRTEDDLRSEHETFFQERQ